MAYDLKILFDRLFDDANAWCDVNKVLEKYHASVVGGIARELGRVAEETKDKNAVVEMAKAIGKYEAYDAKRMADNFTNVAEKVKDGDTIVEMAKAIGKYDEDTALDLAYDLRHIAYETKGDNGVKYFAKTINAVHERDPVTARLIAENAGDIRTLFGDKYKGILSYIEKRRDRESLYAIARLDENYQVSGSIEDIKMDEFGNRQAERLIKLAVYLDYSLKLGLNVSTGPNLQESYDAVERSLHKYIARRGIKDLEKGIKFVPWLETKDRTARKVLRGKKVKKAGIARSYTLASESRLPLDGMRKDVESCAKTAGVDVSVGSNLVGIGEAARKVMSEVSMKKDENIARDVMPKLSRVLNMVYKGGKNFTLYINPSDIETQMEALQNVNSCLSPGGDYFKYTQEYLKNPNTFWAVIKDGEKVVGRATVFVGNDRKGNKRLARVSKVRSIIPVKTGVVDRALKKYADEIGAKSMKKGVMKVRGLKFAYDDYIYDTVWDKEMGPGKIMVDRDSSE